VLIDGRRQIVGFAYPGDLIGLGAQREHVMNAQAIMPTRLRCIPVATLRQSALRDASLAMTLYEAMTLELAATRDLMLITSQRSAVERVAGFLLALSRRNERNGLDPANIELPMTRADIGDFLSLTIETVSRTFTKLKALGAIELPQSSRVKLVDIEELEDLAEGDSHC
jgi:CRP/FNR family transcriptional regulator